MYTELICNFFHYEIISAFYCVSRYELRTEEKKKKDNRQIYQDPVCLTEAGL